MPAKRSDLVKALMPNYASMDEARKASVSMPHGSKMRVRGSLAQALMPGRSRGKGAPKAIRYLEQPL